MQLFETLLNTLNAQTKLSVAADLTLPSETIRTHTVAEWQKRVKQGQSLDLNKRPSIFLFLA